MTLQLLLLDFMQMILMRLIAAEKDRKGIEANLLRDILGLTLEVEQRYKQAEEASSE